MENPSKVLIIEDDLNLVKVYQNKLQREGFEISVATDGEEGIAKAKEEKPNIIILDIILPKMSGRKVLKKLKSDPQTSNIPVLVLSNLGETEEVIEELEEGAEEYMIKAEHSLDDVVERIKSILNPKESEEISEE